MNASIRQLQRLLDDHPTPPQHVASVKYEGMKPLLGKALQAGYRSEKRELRDRLNATNPKTPKPTAPKTPSRAAALVKAMTTPRTRLPLNGDALLDIGSTLLKAQRIDAETAAKLASAVSLSQVPDALMQTLREACHG